MIGDKIIITATFDKEANHFTNFGVNPKYKYMFGVKKDEPIYEIEMEVTECPCIYSHDRDEDYFGYKTSYDYIGEHGEETPYKDFKGCYWKKLDKPHYDLIQYHGICFRIQFHYAVFDYQFQNPYKGEVVRLKINNQKIISQ